MYLEDFEPGQVFHLRAEPMSKAAIMDFARQWDPQRIHLDTEHATATHGGIIASGFQTLLHVFKPVVTEVMAKMANIGGMGFEGLSWDRPVRPDEPLDVEMRIETIRPSRSKPDRGVLTYSLVARNPAGEPVFRVRAPIMVLRRPQV